MEFSIRIANEFGRQLMGRTGGRKAFAHLCSLISEIQPGEIVLLDFEGVEVVTASWINSCLVPLMQMSASEQTDIFPLLLNISADTLDELQLVAENAHLCFLIIPDAANHRNATLVGSLDTGQRETILAVLATPEVTGAELERQRSQTKATAWNNRLKDLYGKRLLRRQKRGREQVYSPIVKEISLDG